MRTLRHLEPVKHVEKVSCEVYLSTFLTPLHNQPGLVVWLALDDLLREHPSGSHDLLIWVSLHDVVQQKLRDSKLVPLVPFTSHRNVHALLLRLHECVVLYFLVRSSTSEKNICAISRVSTGIEDCHRLATLGTE